MCGPVAGRPSPEHTKSLVECCKILMTVNQQAPQREIEVRSASDINVCERRSDIGHTARMHIQSKSVKNLPEVKEIVEEVIHNCIPCTPLGCVFQEHGKPRVRKRHAPGANLRARLRRAPARRAARNLAPRWSVLCDTRGNTVSSKAAPRQGCEDNNRFKI